MGAPRIENEEGDMIFCEFLLAKGDLKSGVVKLRSLLPSFHLNLAAKLSPITFHEKIDAIFIRIFNPVVSELAPEFLHCFRCFSTVDCMLLFYEIFSTASLLITQAGAVPAS